RPLAAAEVLGDALHQVGRARAALAAASGGRERRAERVDLVRALLDEALAFVTEGEEVLGARVVELVGGLGERDLEAVVDAVGQQPRQREAGRLRLTIEDDVDDRPRPLELTPVLG